MPELAVQAVQQVLVQQGSRGIPFGSRITWNNADVGTAKSITLNGMKQWNVKFDDLDKARSKPDVLSESVKEHARALAEQVGSDVRVAMRTGGATAAGNFIFDSNASGDSGPLTIIGRAFAAFRHCLTWPMSRNPVAGSSAVHTLPNSWQRFALGNEQIVAAGRNKAVANG